jgi:hypothetical protein
MTKRGVKVELVFDAVARLAHGFLLPLATRLPGVRHVLAVMAARCGGP